MMTNSNDAWRMRERRGWPLAAMKVCPWALGAVLLVSAEARGEDPPPVAPTIPVPVAPPPTATTPVTPTPTAPVAGPVAAPVAPIVAAPIAVPVATPPGKTETGTSAAESAATSLPTDHEVVIGAYGVGYSGILNVLLPQAVPVGRGDQAGMVPNDKLNLQNIQIPMLGMRKWLSKRYGFEAALGVTLTGGSRTAELGKVTANLAKSTVFGLSGGIGVPVMVADTRHMAFLLVPNMNFGFVSSNVSAEFAENPPPAAKLRGFSFDAGIRAGAEMHFGFIGLPRLTMQAGVGLSFYVKWAGASVSNQSLSDTFVGIGAASNGEPWDIFSSVADLSARYYF